MQEAQNTRIVQDMFAAFGRGDAQALVAAVDDQVVWRPVIGAAPYVATAGERRGKAGVGEFFRVLGETLTFNEFTPKEFVAQGDKVVAIGTYTGTPKATGRQFEGEWTMVFTSETARSWNSASSRTRRRSMPRGRALRYTRKARLSWRAAVLEHEAAAGDGPFRFLKLARIDGADLESAPHEAFARPRKRRRVDERLANLQRVRCHRFGRIHINSLEFLERLARQPRRIRQQRIAPNRRHRRFQVQAAVDGDALHPISVRREDACICSMAESLVRLDRPTNTRLPTRRRFPHPSCRVAR